MEKMSFPKRRAFPNTTTKSSSVYDDVFGGLEASRYGSQLQTVLAPRHEDYTEIFGGFHGSSVCIPVLDLHLVKDCDDDDLEEIVHFDVRRSGFEYTEIFGGFTGLPFTPSFHDLIPYVDDDNDNDCWSPARSGSLSDELRPLAGGSDDKSSSHRLSSDCKAEQSLDDDSKMFNVDYNKSRETLLPGTSHVQNLGVVPEYNESHGEEDEYCSSSYSHVTDDDSNGSREFGERVAEEKQCYKKSDDALGNDKPFMTVTDFSLRTKPSRLPPPSRPPPALVVKKGEHERLDAKLEASRSDAAFEKLPSDDGAPLFFDVEVDVTVCKSSKESIERKEIRNQSYLHQEDVVKVGEETTVSELDVEDRIRSMKSTEKKSDSQGVVWYSNHMADSSVAWTEEPEYFEVIDKTIGRNAFETIKDWDRMNPDPYGHLRPIDSEALDQDITKFKVRREAPRWDENRNLREMEREDRNLGDKLQMKNQSTRLSNRKELQEKVNVNKYESNGIIPGNVLQVGESAKIQDDRETVKGRSEANGNENEMEANVNLKASIKKRDIGKRFIDAQITKKNNRKHEEQIVNDDIQRKLEDMEGTETRGRVDKIIEQEGIEKACVKRNKNKLREAPELKENEVILQESKKHTDRAKKSYVVSGDGQLARETEKEKERLVEGVKQKLNRVENRKEQEVVLEWETIKERNGKASRTEDNNLGHRTAETEAGSNKDVSETKGNNQLHRDAGIWEELAGHDEESEPIERNEYENEVKWDLESDVLIEGDQLKLFDGACKVDEGNASKLSGKHDNPQIWETAFLSEEDRELKNEYSSSIYEPEAGIDDSPVKGNFNRFSKNKEELQDRNTHCDTNNTEESASLPKKKENTGGFGRGVSCNMPDNTSSGMEYSHMPEKIISTEDDGCQKTQATQFTPCQVSKESLVNGMKVEDVSPVLEHNVDTLSSSKNCISQRSERTEKILKDKFAAKDPKVGERVRRETELENELMRKIEEERERERVRRETELENERMIKIEEERKRERVRRETELENERMRKIEEERERERVRRETELENERMRKIEEEKKRERVRRETELGNERKRKIEEERERERVRRETELENERMRKIEEEWERERVRRETELENERMRKIEEERERERVRRETELENERMRKIEEEKKRERVRRETELENECKRKIEEERERERVRRETELENERMRKIEEERERERVRRETELENERMRKIEEERKQERVRRETELENERMRKIEEEREREREREKDRMGVDKEALEARERSYAEPRERLDRASAEVRQRAMAEARERLEKASMEARLRTERAAVERATAEARQRAAEKSTSEKAAFGSQVRVEKFNSDRFPASLKSAYTRQNSLSSDLHYQSSGISNGLKYSYPSARAGAEGESPQRCKARLERYRRTAERAANALAEKNQRDLLAQKEKEERNRVAESLDSEVKRWASGKAGNLRALLSTLQYILGPDSGWQPVPLTEVITSAAVKKAYRRATLCVHPDKLQQRGATVQQKYVCEKVFDLLKEAWNKFNSEER